MKTSEIKRTIKKVFQIEEGKNVSEEKSRMMAKNTGLYYSDLQTIRNIKSGFIVEKEKGVELIKVDFSKVDLDYDEKTALTDKVETYFKNCGVNTERFNNHDFNIVW